MSTKRIKLVVSYDGTDFRGWAAQTGQRTVQRTLKDAVRQVSGEDCEIVGASRTDSGAHAKGQVCHFDTEVPIEPERWSHALNKVLPSDLAIVNSRQMPMNFNSRFCANDRWYRYRILLEQRNPLAERFAHFYGRPITLEPMQESAKKLVGTHDFRAFTAELDRTVENTVRRLDSVTVELHRNEIWIDIVGTAFLRGMMRRISGALLEVGRGRRKVEGIDDLLDPIKATGLHLPEVLPAKGLMLMRVRYGRHPRDNRLNDSDE